MTIFADTSALFALLDARDAEHDAVTRVWRDPRQSGARLLTSSYVMVEVIPLVQQRAGMAAARTFAEDVVPLLEMEWVTPEIHSAAMAMMLALDQRDLGVVDCTSFEVMWRRDIRRAFALDQHFRERGFECVP